MSHSLARRGAKGKGKRPNIVLETPKRVLTRTSNARGTGASKTSMSGAADDSTSPTAAKGSVFLLRLFYIRVQI